MDAALVGVIGKPKRLFVNSEDVMKLLGCKKSYAGQVLREINTEARKTGKHAFPAGKAKIVKERIEGGANEKAALALPITTLSFASISILPG